MTNSPETSPSLLIRLRDPVDQDAWFEFAEIYRPVIIRLARRKGLQVADADDIAQKVLVSIAGVIETHEHDPQRARFRTWLKRIAHNAILNALTRIKPDRGSGKTEFHDLLGQQQARPEDDSRLLQLEHRREVFRWAARQVVGEFQPNTWQAFWMTTVEGRSVADVSRELNKKPGAIYTAKSRIMQRIQQVVTEYDTQS